MDTKMKEQKFQNKAKVQKPKFLSKRSSLWFRTVFHWCMLVHHIFASVSFAGLDLDGSTDEVIRALKKYRIGFLTGWNFLYQVVFLCSAVSCDALEWLQQLEAPLGRRAKFWTDVVFSGLVVPTTTFVLLMFWTVCAIDRELIYPQVYDQIVPLWLNFCVHGNIGIVVAIETILVARREPANQMLETTMFTVSTVLYAIVYYTIYFLDHRWLYGVFGVMTWWQVVLFQCMIWASSYIFYRIQFPINRLIHGKGDITDHDSEDHGIKTLGRINQNGQGCTKNGAVIGDEDKNEAVIDNEDKNGADKTNDQIECKDLKEKEVAVKENGLTVSVNGVEVNGNGTIYKELANVGKCENNELGFKIGESKRRKSNTPIFGNKIWSKKYDSLRSQFEKTKL